jgi:hypothetical protein
MLSDFNLPSIDHLIEGYHYTEVEYDFAQRCPRGTWKDPKNGACVDKNTIIGRRKHRGSSSAAPAPQSQKSSFENNLKISTGNGDYGWAKRGGKPTLVRWGSVAGMKNNDGSITKVSDD